MRDTKHQSGRAGEGGNDVNTEVSLPAPGPASRRRGRARLLAFYLPQFHPIPENDRWWGKGFTDWTNVARARPLFPGHYQPHLPANLGFYDLRLPESRTAQAELAGTHGIEGFCYWHYWFSGKRLLHEPIDDVLASGKPDFPFCLAWANETWSRRWLGEERAVLQKQEYSRKDDLTHIRWLLPALCDDRAVRVRGRPVFLVYRPADLPSPACMSDTFRGECVRHGLPEPFLIGIKAHKEFDARTIGFDATLTFEPHLGVLNDPLGPGLKVYDYGEARQLMKARRTSAEYRTIFVSWDNTPRRGADGVVFTNASPQLFERGLSELIDDVIARPFDDRLVFINAWNEWAEGNHLEPDRRYGVGYLEAVAKANAEFGVVDA